MSSLAAPRATTGGGDAPAPSARLRLTRLAVRDFRNIARLDLVPPPEGIAIVGDNGHGKTNLLEAIYYLQLLRSVRGARDKDLVRFGSETFFLSADADHGPRQDVAVGFERATKRKKVRLDNTDAPRLSDALGALPSVIFSPGDVTLVSGAPTERRRYLDVVLALTSRRYLHALQQYRGALQRRNAALRDVFRSGGNDGRVSVWEPALADSGAVLYEERAAWAFGAAPEFTRLCEAIGERGRASLQYVSALAGAESPRDALAAALEEKRPLDVRRGVTHAGPHRDDLGLTLDARELRLFGSAGQQRTAAIALRMLEAATLRDRTGAAPLFLLDDPFAELDARRSHRILALLQGAGLGQTFLAVPRAEDIPAELTSLARYTVRDGVLAPEGATPGGAA